MTVNRLVFVSCSLFLLVPFFPDIIAAIHHIWFGPALLPADE